VRAAGFGEPFGSVSSFRAGTDGVYEPTR
jgi:hypothetical protein